MIPRGPVLYLDLARQFGWAEGEPGGEIISGSLALAPAGASHGAIFANLDGWLRSRLAGQAYAMLAFEAPFDPRHMRKTNVSTIRLLLGLCAIAEAAAARHRRVVLRECEVRDVRAFLLGRQPAKGRAKIEVMGTLREAGFRPIDDNEADALAGLLYCHEVVKPGSTANVLPLLRGRG